MIINKKKTYEQHDNESINYYRYSIDNIIIPSNLENDLDVTFENLSGDWKEIENRIFAEIARSLWGNDDYYNVRLNKDVQFQEAINNLDRARAILD